MYSRDSQTSRLFCRHTTEVWLYSGCCAVIYMYRCFQLLDRTLFTQAGEKSGHECPHILRLRERVHQEAENESRRLHPGRSSVSLLPVRKRWWQQGRLSYVTHRAPSYTALSLCVSPDVTAGRCQPMRVLLFAVFRRAGSTTSAQPHQKLWPSSKQWLRGNWART